MIKLQIFSYVVVASDIGACERTRSKSRKSKFIYYIRTNIFFQSNGSQHAGQVVIPIRRDILEVRARRML